MKSLKICKYPYPFEAWLTISSDPDCASYESWLELDNLIFKKLKLPWANSIFLFSFNQNLPDQVSLDKYPEIGKQPTDAIHTWGDFVHAGEKGFSAQDAILGIELLKKHNINPLIWVDHSRFTGNMIHNNKWGSTPFHTDSSGYKYKVYEYTLDLVKESGVRYIWSGELAPTIGQDRKVNFFEWGGAFSLKPRLSYLIRQVFPMMLSRGGIKKISKKYELLYENQFPDGTKLYCFNRFGKWKHADILGLSKIISKQNIDKLIHKKGAMVAYTHLGKRNPEYSGESHVPEETVECFEYVKKKHEEKSLMFSPVSELLDYVVLRNNMEINGNQINFKSDGIRFTKLQESDLSRFRFSFRNYQKDNEPKFCIEDKPAKFYLESHGKGYISARLHK